MGMFDEYITNLEGESTIDPLKVAGDLHGLYTQDIGTREAKIAELNAKIDADKQAMLAKDVEITRWKAKNFDLAMSIPSTTEPVTNQSEDGQKPTGANIRIKDLFDPNVRKRHNGI